MSFQVGSRYFAILGRGIPGDTFHTLFLICLEPFLQFAPLLSSLMFVITAVAS